MASGKGGTGKTTIAVSLALAAEYCQFADYDVEAPNGDIFLKPEIKNIKKVTIKHPYFLTDTSKDFSGCASFCHYNAIAVIGSEVLFYPELAMAAAAACWLARTELCGRRMSRSEKYQKDLLVRELIF